jgi:hypothetical protein
MNVLTHIDSYCSPSHGNDHRPGNRASLRLTFQIHFIVNISQKERIVMGEFRNSLL